MWDIKNTQLLDGVEKMQLIHGGIILHFQDMFTYIGAKCGCGNILGSKISSNLEIHSAYKDFKSVEMTCWEMSAWW